MQHQPVEFNTFGSSKASQNWGGVEKPLLKCIFVVLTSVLEMNNSELFTVVHLVNWSLGFFEQMTSVLQISSFIRQG